MSEDKKHIEDVFREALQGHETLVSPQVWAGIQSGIASGAGSISATGNAILGKAAAVIGFSALITAATISEINHLPSNQASVANDSHQIEMVQTEPAQEKNTTNQTTSTEEPTKTQTVSEPSLIQPTGLSNTPETHKANEAANNVASASVEVSTNSDLQEINEPVTSRANRSGGNQTQSVPKDQENGGSVDGTELADQTTNNTNTSANEASSNESNAPTEPQPKTSAYFTHNAEALVTPNGDGFNDFFEVDGSGFETFYIRIFTRMGTVIFETDNIEFQWKGLDRFGNSVPDGYYFYEIQAIGVDGLPYTEKNAKGSITLRRN